MFMNPVDLENDNENIFKYLVFSRVPGELCNLDGRTLLNCVLPWRGMNDVVPTTIYISTLRSSGVPSNPSRLKVGVCVILTSNLDLLASWFDEWC